MYVTLLLGRKESDAMKTPNRQSPLTGAEALCLPHLCLFVSIRGCPFGLAKMSTFPSEVPDLSLFIAFYRERHSLEALNFYHVSTSLVRRLLATDHRPLTTHINTQRKPKNTQKHPRTHSKHPRQTHSNQLTLRHIRRKKPQNTQKNNFINTQPSVSSWFSLLITHDSSLYLAVGF